MPLLTKVGCNSAACHGAAGGQGGFELSLFGFDLKKDHLSMTSGPDAPRADWSAPERSRLLRKPSGEEDHGGGQLFDVNSDAYRLLLSWIEARAPGVPVGKDWLQITSLEVSPEQVTFTGADTTPVQLKVVAQWNDGSAEEITRYARFESKDTSVARIDPAGRLRPSKAGSTSVLVYYDRAITPIDVIVPLAAHPDPSLGKDDDTTSIDAAVLERLAALRVSPADVCDDATFIRRVFLDLTGTLPSAREAKKFVASQDPHKRRKVVNTLLSRATYADYWAGWLCELFGCTEPVMPIGPIQREQALQSYEWMRARLIADDGYDRIVAGLVLGLGRQREQTLEDYSARMSRMVHESGFEEFAAQPTMPYYWGRTNIRKASEKALAFSHAFLGVRLQCAECHKHPFDRWTKEDFEGLERFFTNVRYGTPDADKDAYDHMVSELTGNTPKSFDARFRKAMQSGRTAPWREVFVDEAPATTRAGLQPVSPESGPLAVLLDWLQAAESPLLDLAIVNRVWEHHFGVGIVDTPDDLSIGNPPQNRRLLDELAKGFAENGRSLRWLHREILTSRSYQRSTGHGDHSRLRKEEFSQARFRRLPAEVLWDAVTLATAGQGVQRDPSRFADGRMIGSQSVLRKSNRQRPAVDALGQPRGTAVCQRERRNDATLQTALTLYNSPQLIKVIDRREGWISELRQQHGQQVPDGQMDELVREAFWRCLAREPTEAELQECQTLLQTSNNSLQSFRDLVWALVNTREFSFNH